MKVCIVVEGCYPYVVGGVSSWVHSLIQQFPEVDFIIQTIVANRSLRGKFVYELPDNVSEVREIYLEDSEYVPSGKQQRIRLNKTEYQALRSLVMDEDTDWPSLFRLLQKRRLSGRLLMDKDFLHIAMEFYRRDYPNLIFSDFLWTLRSMYLPLFLCLQTPPAEADLYHCVSTGYAGVYGAMASLHYHSPLLVSEHGIYSREREEDIIKADWVQGIYKNLWISHFKKMSVCAYQNASRVTALFEYAAQLQAELGCPRDKITIIPNGIDVSSFSSLPGKTADDTGFHIGAILRIAPIKDVKTLLSAYYYAKQREPALKLWVMGPWEADDSYAREVFALKDSLQLEDIVFTGRVDVHDYLGRMDATILTSISEGQPLTILESFATRCPVIATNVGNCRGLIYGEGDDNLGAAGIVTDVMSVSGIANAMVTLAQNPGQAKYMGEIGYRRLLSKYQLKQMQQSYRELYQNLVP